MKLDPLLEFKHQDGFKRDLWGDEFAHCLAKITMGWGNIEYRMFLLLQAIDFKNAAKWAALLFAPRILAQRKKIVRQQIEAAVRISYPNFLAMLDDELSRLQSVQGRRNILAHGFWLESKSDQKFNVQPLNLKNGTKILDDAVEVDHGYLATLIQDIDRVVNGLASLGSEMLAHQQLKKWDKNYVSKG